MDSITQDMKYRYSLMKYAEKYGVSRASRKYDKSRSYIYFWRKRFDGTIESLACRSRRPHSHPNQHTPEEMKLIQKMRRRNPKLGIVELWARLRSRGYSRCVESLRRVLRREGLLPEAPGRKYYECDIDFDGSYRNAKRIIYSNDGLIFYTEDHYESFQLLYGEATP